MDAEFYHYYRHRERPHFATALALLQRGHLLSTWERAFLAAIARADSISQRQGEKLHEIKADILIRLARPERGPRRRRRAKR